MICGNIDLACTACRLSEHRSRVVPGGGSCESRIMLIGEAPGKEEDLRGQPFVGRAGRLLDETLLKLGVDRKSVYVGNIVKCRPPKNRRPRADEIETCTSLYLLNEIDAVAPEVICALGQTAAGYFMPVGANLSELVGEESLVIVNGRKIRFFVTYHPAACLYQKKNLAGFRKGLRSALKAAALTSPGRR